MTLPSDYLAASSGGVKSKLGTWEDPVADATGTAGHYRLYASDGVTCHEQGDITATGGGGALTLVTVSITAGQPVIITAWSKTAPGA